MRQLTVRTPNLLACGSSISGWGWASVKGVNKLRSRARGLIAASILMLVPWFLLRSYQAAAASGHKSWLGSIP